MRIVRWNHRGPIPEGFEVCPSFSEKGFKREREREREFEIKIPILKQIETNINGEREREREIKIEPLTLDLRNKIHHQLDNEFSSC
mgnify:CR=1 FL=1